MNSSSIPAGNTSRSATQKLKDGVDNNDYKFDEGQSGSLVAGKNFGIVTNDLHYEGSLINYRARRQAGMDVRIVPHRDY